MLHRPEGAPGTQAQGGRPAMQRVEACGSLVVRRAGDRTRLSRLAQEGAAKIRLPEPHRQGVLEAVLINTAGGLTGGDRIAWSVAVEAGGAAAVTTQACEKIYRASSGEATVSASLSAGADASLAWLPQETILFDGAALGRSLAVDLHPSARLLLCEATVFGRTARGERVERAFFRDRWRVRVDGRLVHAEDFAIGPAVAATLAGRAAAGGGSAVATILVIGAGSQERLAALRDILGPQGGASAWTVAGTGKLLARLVAEDGYALRKRLMPALSLLNGQAGLPKLWSL